MVSYDTLSFTDAPFYRQSRAERDSSSGLSGDHPATGARGFVMPGGYDAASGTLILSGYTSPYGLAADTVAVRGDTLVRRYVLAPQVPVVEERYLRTP